MVLEEAITDNIAAHHAPFEQHLQGWNGQLGITLTFFITFRSIRFRCFFSQKKTLIFFLHCVRMFVMYLETQWLLEPSKNIFQSWLMVFVVLQKHPAHINILMQLGSNQWRSYS